MKSKSLMGWLVVLCVLGTAARLYRIDAEGMWSDELFTMSMVRYHPLGAGLQGYRPKTVLEIEPNEGFLAAKSSEQHPPLYDLILKATTMVTGYSDLALRGPSAAFGVLLLVAFAVFLRREFADRPWLPVFAVTLASFSWPLIDFAKEARSYTLGMLMCGLLALFLVRRATREGAPARIGWPEALTIVAALHTHYNTAFVAVMCAVYAFVRFVKARQWLDIAKLVAIGASFLPWLYLARHSILTTSSGGVAWRHIGGPEAARLAAQFTAEVLTLEVAIGVGLACVAGLWQKRHSRTDRQAAMALLAMSLGYLAVAAFIANRGGTFMSRHVLFALPSIFLLLAFGVDALELPSLIKAVALTIMCAVALWHGERDHQVSERENYRGAAEWIAKTWLPGDLIVVTWGPNLNLYRHYLDQFTRTQTFEYLRPVSSKEEAAAFCEKTELPPHGRLFVFGHYSHTGEVNALIESCKSHYPAFTRHDVFGISLGEFSDTARSD